MPNFTAGTSFGANDTVTNTKLNALIADASINPEYALSINSGTIGTLGCTRGTVATLNTTTGTITSLNSTNVNATNGTIASFNSTNGTFQNIVGPLVGSVNSTAGTVQTLTAGTLSGVLTGGTYTGTIGGTVNLTSGTISNFRGPGTAVIAGITISTGTGTDPYGYLTNVGIGSSGVLGTGWFNTAIGSRTLGSNTGSYNTAIGNQSLQANTSGSKNSALGDGSLVANTSGNFNTAIGNDSLGGNTTGTANVAIGNTCMLGNTTGITNTAVGYSALGGNTTGSNNSSLGYNALGANTTGKYNTAIGYLAGVGGGAYQNTTGSNNSFIGNGAVNSVGGSTISNTVVLGDSAIVRLYCYASLTNPSDARDKSNIEDIPIGIEFIKELRPVKFTWNQRDGKRAGLTDAGFIAQESLDVVNKYNSDWMGLVDHQNPDNFAMSYVKLIPVLVKSIQQLSAKVDSLEAQLSHQ